MKTKLKIVIPAAIAVIAVIVAIIFIKLPEAENLDIDSLMSTAQKYLVEMNYEQAIAEFEKIIELEPNNVEAYLGLAQAYRDSGDIDKAIEVLEKGYELTGDERLLDMLEELTGEAVVEETETVVTTISETETETKSETEMNLETETTTETITTASSEILFDSSVTSTESVNEEIIPNDDSEGIMILQTAYDTVFKYFDDDYFLTGEPLSEKYYYSLAKPTKGMPIAPTYNPIVKVQYDENGNLNKMVALYLALDISSDNIKMTGSDYGVIVSPTCTDGTDFILIGSGKGYIYKKNKYVGGTIYEGNEKKGNGTLIESGGNSQVINCYGRTGYLCSWQLLDIGNLALLGLEYKGKSNNVYTYESRDYTINVHMSGSDVEKIVTVNDGYHEKTEYTKHFTDDGIIEWCAAVYRYDEKCDEAYQYREISPDELFSRIIPEFSEEDFNY